MKSRLIVLVVILILFFAAHVVYNKYLKEITPIEDVLPRGASLYIKVSDIAKGLDGLKEIKLWKNISRMDIGTIMTKSGMPHEEVNKYLEITGMISDKKTGLLVENFFGQEIALAVYPSDSSKDNILGLISEILPDVVLATRITKKADFIEFLTKKYNKLDEKIKIYSHNYQDYDISSVYLNNNVALVYTKINDLLILSFNEKIIYRCIDTFKNDEVSQGHDSILKDKYYSATRLKLPKDSNLIIYGNLESIMDDLTRIIDSAASIATGFKGAVQLSKIFDKMQGFKTMAFALVSSGDVTTSKAVVTFDEKELSHQMAKAQSCLPHENSTVRFVPKDTIVYQWNCCFDADGLYDAFLKETQKEQKEPLAGYINFDISRVIEDMETGLGLSIKDDIIPAIGNETGVFLLGLDTTGFLPFPEILFFTQIKNTDAINNAIASALSGENLLWQSEDYQGFDIQYMMLPLGGKFQPSYYLLDNYLLLATSRSIIQKSIDAYQGKDKSLLTNEDFNAVNLGLTEKNNAVVFLKTDTVISKAKEVGEWIIDQMKRSQRGRELRERQIEELKRSQKVMQSGLMGYEVDLQSFMAKIDAMKSKSLDTTKEEAELATIDERVQLMRGRLESMAQTEAALTQMAKKDEGMDPKLAEFYFRRIISPILEGLEQNKATGIRMTITGDAFEAMIFSLWK